MPVAQKRVLADKAREYFLVQPQQEQGAERHASRGHGIQHLYAVMRRRLDRQPGPLHRLREGARPLVPAHRFAETLKLAKLRKHTAYRRAERSQPIRSLFLFARISDEARDRQRSGGQREKGLGQVGHTPLRRQGPAVPDQPRDQAPEQAQLRHFNPYPPCPFFDPLVVRFHLLPLPDPDLDLPGRCQPAPLLFAPGNAERAHGKLPEVRPRLDARRLVRLHAIERRREHIQHRCPVEPGDRQPGQLQERLGGRLLQDGRGRRREKGNPVLVKDSSQHGQIRLQSPGDDADLIEAVVIGLDQRQDFLADQRQLVVRPDGVHDPHLRRLAGSSRRG